MIRSSIHSLATLTATPTALGMRFGSAWDGSARLEQPSYQPKQRDLHRAEQLD